MAIVELLLDPSLERLLRLALADLLILAAAATTALAAAIAVFLHIRRRPVYIAATLRPPFWRKRMRHGIGAAAILGVAVILLL
jgi:hypothetical protein